MLAKSNPYINESLKPPPSSDDVTNEADGTLVPPGPGFSTAANPIGAVDLGNEGRFV